MDPLSDEEAPLQLGRRARKALATRQALFQAGLTAFEHRPLNVVSVLDITEASDVAKGVFYLHFRGKDEYLISLWEFVQQGFLEEIRQRLATCTSRRARIEAAAAYHYQQVSRAPRECRFWIRMSSYFGDEIGQPGQMGHLRLAYLRLLGEQLLGGAPDEVDTHAMHMALIVDATCWGLISHAIQPEIAALDEESFVKTVTSAVRPHLR